MSSSLSICDRTQRSTDFCAGCSVTGCFRSENPSVSSIAIGFSSDSNWKERETRRLTEPHAQRLSPR